MRFDIKKDSAITLTLSGLCLNYAAPFALRSHYRLPFSTSLMWGFFLVSMLMLVCLGW